MHVGSSTGYDDFRSLGKSDSVNCDITSMSIRVKEKLFSEILKLFQRDRIVARNDIIEHKYMRRTVLLKYLKMQLNADLKIILSNHQNNKLNKLLARSSKFFAARSNFLHNYFDGIIKIIFRSISILSFKYFRETIFPYSNRA